MFAWRASGGSRAAGRLAEELVQRSSGNGSALCEKERVQVLLTLDVVFRGGRAHVFTCSDLVVWCLVFGVSLAGGQLVKASGRLAGMRGPATRLKRDVRPVSGVMSNGRRVCVRDKRGSLCVRENKYCLVQAVYV